MKAVRLILIIISAIVIISAGDIQIMKDALAFLGLFFVPMFIIGAVWKLLS